MPPAPPVIKIVLLLSFIVKYPSKLWDHRQSCDTNTASPGCTVRPRVRAAYALQPCPRYRVVRTRPGPRALDRTPILIRATIGGPVQELRDQVEIGGEYFQSVESGLHGVACCARIIGHGLADLGGGHWL